MNRYYWRIADGRIWGFAEARWMDEREIPAGYAAQNLHDGGEPSGAEYLKQTVRFYGGRPGELAGLEETRAAKYVEIITGANAAKALLSSRYSTIEEGTWPEQEAGARALLNDAANVKDITARLILADATAAASAVALVRQLAEIDGTSDADFAARITANADLAHQLGILTLTEQRGYEALLRSAETIEAIAAIVVDYTVLRQEEE